jgi:putative redox protein
MEVKVSVKQTSASASEGQARNHRVQCDRPEQKGGHDDGPMGGELFLMGLGGCFMSNLLAAIEARNKEISGIEIAISGQLEGTPPRFTNIKLSVSGNYSNKKEMEKLTVIAERGCIVANTIKDAVELDIIVQ